MPKLVAMPVVLVGLLIVVAGLYRLGGSAGPSSERASLLENSPGVPRGLRIALVPERDIFEQRRRYLDLGQYLSTRMGMPVEIVTLNTYEAILSAMAEGQVEAAFVGSLVGALAVDRLDARPLVKPLLPGDVSSYCGVLFVAADSPIQTIDDLAGQTIAMVRTTTAGELFPLGVMHEHGLLRGARVPSVIWVGTHDDVILEVMTGRAAAGAVKNLRLDAFRAKHPDARVRRLAESDFVPNNALVLSSVAADRWGVALRQVLLTMHEDTRGHAVIEAFGAQRFVPCERLEFDAVCAMAQRLGSAWQQLQVAGPPPRSATSPSADILDRERVGNVAKDDQR